MADKKKTSDKQTASPDEIEDAVVLDTADAPVLPEKASVQTEQSNPDSDQNPGQIEPDPVVSSDDAASIAERAEQGTTDPSAEAAQVMSEDQVEVKPEESDISKAKQPEAQARQTETVIVRKAGFVPMLLGGVAAAAIGFGVSYSGVLNGLPLPGLADTQVQMDALSQQIAAQDSALADMSGRLTALEEAPASEGPSFVDPAPVLEDLSTQIGVLAQRLDVLEARPATDGSADDPQTQASLDAARTEMDAIRQALDAQRNEISALTEAASQQEQAARDTALGVMQRAALTRIQTALDSGTPFAEAVMELRDSGVAVPEPLIQQAGDGVVTLSALQTAFPDLARDALRAARQENGRTGFGGFLETQLGLRSLEPRDGEDPDAVLSRVEAAVQSGDLTRAVTELEALPDPAVTVLADWRSRVELRIAAVAAAQDLSQVLNTN